MRYFIRTTQSTFGEIVNIICEYNGEYIHFPLSEENGDYQAYLAWVAEGNTAEEWTGD
jgi:hypothetical protein